MATGWVALSALSSSTSAPLLHRLRLLCAFPRATVRSVPIRTLSSSAVAEKRITVAGAQASRLAKVVAMKLSFDTVSSDHAGTRSGTTRGSSTIKPNRSPDQICSSQREVKRKFFCRSYEDSRHCISPKAVDLMEKVLMLPDGKDEVSKALDKWARSEGKFPIAYVKQAMQVFEREENWRRIIQISEWLVEKEEGKTLRTFEVFLKALDMHQRIDEAEAVWKNNILNTSWSIPRRLVAYVLNMFERHHKPLEVIKLFTIMEGNGRKMDKKSIKRVSRAYEQVGFLEMKKQLLLKYNIPVKV